MTTYNGHRSWNAWNVALWIGDDEGLYNLALDCLRQAKGNRRKAARLMLQDLPERTPDGARYNLACVYEALDGLN